MAEQLYWRDIEDSLGNWSGLGVEVEPGSTDKPPLYLRTGANARIKLMHHDMPLFWATLARDHGGVWLVRNPLADGAECRLLAPIDSPTVEQHAALAPELRIRAWSRYFVSRLSESARHFLTPGFWLAQGLLPEPSSTASGLDHWRFTSVIDPLTHVPNWHLYGEDFLDNLQPQTLEWIDWWHGGGKLIGLHRVDPEAGRLKWWRKKAREGSLAPILLWYVGGLASYVVIDGHYRLQAAIAENLAPSFIVLSATRERGFAPSLEHQQRIMDSLRKRGDAVPRNPALSTENLNRVLIQAFDDRPQYRSATPAWAGNEPESQWCDEVRQCLGGQGLADEVDAVIGRHG
ncbi:hypothetical protein PEQA60_43680 [Pseudomonas sp. Eqa60]|uniref:hypothetical protein n=1 Tax=Pseudomonas TaxID=286 RepID=UPI0016017239|nr:MULTISPECIES: hypothetical protein [unclassified Pseudomonas]MBB1616977.1 hypothetical protein [Pseudomonas sp. UMC65]MBB1618734.1 hypothetical protein [Pseudomonas sp. UME65]BCQ70378.1 hypothetical protein PEQA60_43680 [Pseudomonas sp. Eqa60]